MIAVADLRGKAFVHVFAHRTLPNLFEGTWASEGALLHGGAHAEPRVSLRLQEHMLVTDWWIVPGTHYARTLEAWRLFLL